MRKILNEYLNYINSDEELYYKIRMERIWNDEAYLYCINLTLNVIKEYKGMGLIPISIVYFFTSEIDYLIGTISHPDFYFDATKAYIELVNKRKAELLNLQKKFFSGELLS